MTTLRKQDWHVLPIPLDVAQGMTVEHHYSQGGSNTGTFMHGLFRKETPFRCMGMCWWLPPTRSAAEASWEGDWQSVLSLSRMVILPDVPKNAASFLLTRSTRFIGADGRFRCLVTYADTWRGHTGHIYKVSGWEEMGLTSPETVCPHRFGRMVARKAGPRTRTNQEMESLGYINQGRHPKWKFRLLLGAARKPRERGLFDGRETRIDATGVCGEVADLSLCRPHPDDH